MSRLVVVSNRVADPRKAAAGGLAVALGDALSSTGGLWFGWSGQIARGKSVEIKGVNGDVEAVLASGNQVEVVARKHARRGNPADESSLRSD